MTQPFDDFERRLLEALNQEASLAMTMTDTPRELRRWHDAQRSRQSKLRLAASAAAAAAVVGVAIGASIVSGHPHKQTPANPPTPTGPLTSRLESLQALPAVTSVADIHGPVNFNGQTTFGAVWATGSGTSAGHLYRLNPTTGVVLSDSTYAGPVRDGLPPFRVGQVMLLPSMPAHGPRGYLVYDADGRPTGRVIAASAPGSGVGDATGGWVQLSDTTLGRLDASGHLQQSVTPTSAGAQISAIGFGPAGVWIGLTSGDLARLDPRSGTVLRRVSLDDATGVNVPVQVLSTDTGVIAATNTNTIVRVDPGGTVTAVSTEAMRPRSLAFITMGPDGNLWAEPNEGGIAVLDPRTLALVRGMQVFPDSRDGGVSGFTVTSQRVFIGDIDHARTATFAAP